MAPDALKQGGTTGLELYSTPPRAERSRRVFLLAATFGQCPSGSERLSLAHCAFPPDGSFR